MSINKDDPVIDEPVPAPARGGAPVYRYDETTSRWVDSYLDDGLVAYWPLGNVHTDSGSALDASGNGTDLTLQNGVTTGDDAPISEGYTFDGTDDRAEGSGTPLNPSSIGGSITVSCWFRLNTERTTDTTRRIVALYDDWRPGYGLNLQSGSVPNQISTCIAEGTGSNGDVAHPIEVGRWYHATYRMIDESVVDLHVDGEFIGEGSITALESGDGMTFKVGGHASQGRESPVSVSDIRVYDRAIGKDEISALYQQGRPASIPGRVAHLPLNRESVSDGTASDISNNGNDGDLIGGVMTGVDSPTGEGFRFDGVDDRVVIPNDPSFDLTEDFAVSLWAKWDEVPTRDVEFAVMGLVQGSPNNVGQFGFAYRDTEGIWWRVTDQSQGESSIIRDAHTPTQGQWEHYVGVYDTTNEQVLLYVDGEQVGSASQTVGAVAQTGEDFIIGSDANAEELFPGDIADVRIYDQPLSASEVHDLYYSSRIIDPACRIGHWTMNDRHITGDELEDLSPADNTATLSGGVTTGIDAPVGQGFSFDGVDDYLLADSLTGFEGTSQAASLTFWARAEWSSLDVGDVRMVNTNNTGSLDEWRGYQNNTLALIISANGTNYAIDTFSNSPPDNEWVFLHWRWEYDSSADETTADGGHDGSWQETRAIPGQTDDPAEIVIGNWNADYFPGDLSDIRFYDRRLSDAEVERIYDVGN